MPRPHQLGALNRWGKGAAPRLSRAVAAARLTGALGHLETYLAILQGKGAGTGWDLGGETAAVLRFVDPLAVGTVFDVGAQQGSWSRALARRLPETVRFYLFEPQIECADQLTWLPIEHLEVVQAAVGEKEGTAFLFGTGGAASLFERHDSYWPDRGAVGGSPVRVVTLDAFAAQGDIDRIDVLKLDVEGNELHVLHGARELLDAGAITTIQFEFGSADVWSRTFFRDFWDLLTPLGYHLWRIAPGGELVAVTEYYEDLETFRGVSNYIASHTPAPSGRPAGRA